MVIVVLSLLGLCLGSFTNALVWRMHEKQGREQRAEEKGRSKKTKLTPNELSILKGRSMCPNCHHTLAWHDLLPVLSWLFLRGKCRYCHKAISWQYPLVELTTALLFVLSYIYWPNTLSSQLSTLNFAVWLLVLTNLIALAVYDLKWMLLPNKLVASLLAISAIQLFLRFLNTPLLAVVLGAFWGALIIGGLFYGLFLVSDGHWIGGGDVKLGPVLGLIVGGPVKAILIIFLASLLGSLVGSVIILLQKANLKAKIPFGPFLITATIIVYIFGNALINWYHIHFLLT